MKQYLSILLVWMFLVSVIEAEKSGSKNIGIVYGLDANGDGFLSIRKKPKAKEIGKLYNGDKVKILDKQGKWYKVKDIQFNTIGWSHSNWIKIEKKTQYLKTKHTTTQPVMIGGEDDLDPCSYGRIAYSTPRGTPVGTVAIKSGRGDKFETIDILKDGTYVYECDDMGEWLGIIYGKSSCGVNSPIPKNQPYKGTCKSGWIHKDRYELIAG